jgi:hypothetical protein
MIFLDTSYILALLLKKDKYHSISKDLGVYLSHEKKVINITVLQEVLNSLNILNYPKDISSLIECMLSMDEMEYLTEEDYMKAIELYGYYNKSINFSDCTMLVTMQKYNITNIVSFDSDFDKINGINRISGF